MCIRDRVCTPGATQPCVCPGAAVGAQACGGDGRRWEVCVCPGGVRADGGTLPPPDDDDDDDDDDPPAHAAAAVDSDAAVTPTDGATAPGDVSTGAMLFATHCAGCHGPAGEGTAQGPDLREEVPEHSDRELTRTVLQGEDDMPATSLSPQEMTDLLAFLRARFGAAAPDDD